MNESFGPNPAEIASQENDRESEFGKSGSYERIKFEPETDKGQETTESVPGQPITRFEKSEFGKPGSYERIKSEPVPEPSKVGKLFDRARKFFEAK